MDLINYTEKPKDIVGKYKLENTIGTGTFGKVKLATNTVTNEKVAIKIMDKTRLVVKEDMNRIIREMNYLKSLDHPNIIKVIEVSDDMI
jgi:serine/threonine protein kinase